MSRIGELLIKNGVVTETQLNEALEKQKEEKSKRLGEILIELGYLDTADFIWILSEQVDIPFVELQPKMLDSELIDQFPEKMLYDNVVLPLYETDDTLYIAVGDPTDADTTQEIKKFTRKEVVASGADPKKIEQLLNRIFLTRQVNKIIGQHSDGSTTIKAKDNQATIKFADDSGKVAKEKTRSKIFMQMGKAKKPKRQRHE